MIFNVFWQKTRKLDEKDSDDSFNQHEGLDLFGCSKFELGFKKVRSYDVLKSEEIGIKNYFEVAHLPLNFQKKWTTNWQEIENLREIVVKERRYTLSYLKEK